MVERKIQSKSRYFMAFIIGTIIFLLGFAIVYGISYLEYQRISNVQGSIAYDIFEDKIRYTLFGNDICSEESYKKISEDLGFQGRIIDDLEKKFGKDDSRVLFRKQFYTLILLEHFEFVNTRNSECDTDTNTILFFYSNEPSDLGKSEDVGKILGAVHERTDDLVIYSFDVNLDSELIRGLKERYFVERPLEILINENVKVNDVQNIDDIEKHLNS